MHNIFFVGAVPALTPRICTDAIGLVARLSVGICKPRVSCGLIFSDAINMDFFASLDLTTWLIIAAVVVLLVLLIIYLRWSRSRSPKAVAQVTQNGITVKVIYSQPSRRGRTVFGGVVKHDKVWRTGANAATIIELAQDVRVNGNRLAKGRLPLLHMKDYMVNDENAPQFAEIGVGNLPWPQIIAAAEESGCEWFIVEQDTCPGDPFDSLQISFDYIRANLVS